MGTIERVDGDKSPEPGMPDYLVRPFSYSSSAITPLPESISIVDFGESFFDTAPPATLHTPLPLRAPEVILGDTLSHSVDLWGMGCLVRFHDSMCEWLQEHVLLITSHYQLFELFTGQPPFDVLMLTPGVLMSQMEELATDTLPLRWAEPAAQLIKKAMEKGDIEDGQLQKRDPDALQQWLETVYFDETKSAELSVEDARILGGMVGKMLRFEPKSRESAARLLDTRWLHQSL